MCLNPCYVRKTTMYVFDTCPCYEFKFTYHFRGDDYHEELPVRKDVEYIPVPCGKCVECLSQYSEIWSFRIMREVKLHKQSCMITLTYANAPSSGVQKRDFQLFMKSLRKSLEPLKIRFFVSGEYGAKFSRPHYHVIVFGWFPPDVTYFFSRNGHAVYKSDKVAKLWKRGYISVEDVTLESAKYCAKYLQKLQKLPVGLNPPFTLMSNRPGIGFNEHDFDYLKTDKLYFRGKYISTPRYLLKKAEDYGAVIDDLKAFRIDKAKMYEKQSKRRLSARQRFVSRFGEKFINGA